MIIYDLLSITTVNIVEIGFPRFNSRLHCLLCMRSSHSVPSEFQIPVPLRGYCTQILVFCATRGLNKSMQLNKSSTSINKNQSFFQPAEMLIQSFSLQHSDTITSQCRAEAAFDTMHPGCLCSLLLD